MASKVITKKDLSRIAHLSRLPITEKESYIADQLTQATDYVQVLNELNTQKITPTYQVNNKKNVLRPDIVGQSFTQKEALSQAPKTHDGYFVTSATIKK